MSKMCLNVYFSPIDTVTPNMGWLFKSDNVHTSARDKGDGTPITDVSLQERKARVRPIKVTSTSTILAGENELIEIRPTDGTIATIVSVAIAVDAIQEATTGHNEVTIYQDTYYRDCYARVFRSYDKSIRMRANILNEGEFYTGYGPENNEQLQQSLKDLLFSDDLPLIFRFSNNTDADQKSLREVRLIVREEAVTW
ncbi:hypothetical protein LC087_19485 (plasmid) [Bacillus carboniphilus]|uniref:Uncharacterized protein n=1 Tax=Bacillus carboniphilus TaxID=86663 RepID=A0ABY9JYK7_9BACI|nr:hypothetical protein [Bacillus carboniphilus]WLR44484.1 hypothetical protein LC087_19485 [Bacillus carboniphilus]